MENSVLRANGIRIAEGIEHLNKTSVIKFYYFFKDNGDLVVKNDLFTNQKSVYEANYYNNIEDAMNVFEREFNSDLLSFKVNKVLMGRETTFFSNCNDSKYVIHTKFLGRKEKHSFDKDGNCCTDGYRDNEVDTHLDKPYPLSSVMDLEKFIFNWETFSEIFSKLEYLAYKYGHGRGIPPIRLEFYPENTMGLDFYVKFY